MATNKLTTIGRLTRDPEYKEINGRKCLKFTLASDSSAKGADGNYLTNFYFVTAWGQQAETLVKYVSKGTKLMVIGNLSITNYKDTNGVDRTAVNVMMSDFEFVDSRQNTQNQSTGGANMANPFDY